MVRIIRSYPAPESLRIEKEKAGGKYNCPDVTERLSRDFHNKSYLCEISPLYDPEVEHLLPHKGGKYRDRMFDWENLFWSCGHCNGVKKSGKYDEGIINCCKTDPEEWISSEYINGDVFFCERAAEENAVVSRTVQLLNEVFNKRNTGIRICECDARLKALAEEMNVFYDVLESYRINRGDRKNQRALKSMLSRESVFAAFKREYIRDHQNLYPELFAQLITEC